MNKIKMCFAILLTVIFALLSVVGCAEKGNPYSEELYALDTVITISLYNENTDALGKAKTEIRRLESLLSVTDENSDISRINSAPESFVAVSNECFELIKASLAVSRNSGGSFDITVYPAVRLWGFTGSDYRIPTADELCEIKEYIGYNNIQLNEKEKSVKVPENTCLDLGGIAKGYIADRAAEALIDSGVTSALLNFGGNIRLIGAKPTGEDFQIGIKTPFGEGYFGTINARNVTLSTAGGYERYFEKDGKLYHHILDPFTASPAESDAISATVLGKSGAVCDALSTAAFVLGSEGIYKLAQKYPAYGFVLLTDEKVYISQDLSADFKLADAYKDLKIVLI